MFLNNDTKIYCLLKVKKKVVLKLFKTVISNFGI